MHDRPTVSLVHLCPLPAQSDVHSCKMRTRAHSRRHLTHALENMDYNKGLSGASMLTSCSAALPAVLAHLAVGGQRNWGANSVYKTRWHFF
jgi:hypothetical protein